MDKGGSGNDKPMATTQERNESVVTGGLNTNSLRLSKRVTEITCDPFCLFQVNDYLPSDMYQALLETFPNEQWFIERITGDKRRLTAHTTLRLSKIFVANIPYGNNFSSSWVQRPSFEISMPSYAFP